MHRKLFIVSILFAVLLAASCSKDKKDDPPAATRKVLIKAETGGGGIIQTAVYGVDANTHTDMNLSTTNWSSPELTAPAGAYNAHVVVNGSAPTDAGTLTVKIYVNGDLKKEVSANPGKVLSVNTGYIF